MAICVVIAVAISALFVIRKVNYNNGKEQGYILGYHPSGWYPFLIVQDAVTEDLIIPHRVAPLAEKAGVDGEAGSWDWIFLRGALEEGKPLPQVICGGSFYGR